MENSNIDHLFKSKLEHRKVEFRESYWTAAEQMIAEQERKRNSRRYLWLLFLLPLLIGGYWFWQSQSSQLTIPVSKDVVTNNSANSNQEDQERANLSIGDADSETTGNTKTDKLNTATSDKNNQTKTRAIAGPNQTTIKDKSPVNHTTKRKESNNPVIPFSAIKEFESSTNTTNTNQQAKLTPQAFNQAVENNAEAENNALSTLNELSPSVADATSESIVNQYSIAQLVLPKLLYQLDESEPTPNKEELQKYKVKKFRIGLMAGSVFGLNLEDHGFNLTGAQAGLTSNYRLGRHWSINTDLLYEFSRKSIVFPNGNNTLITDDFNQYSFGLESRQLEVELKHAHLLKMPVYVQYHLRRRHQFEAGIQLSYTLGQRGIVKDEVFSTSLAANQRTEENTWLSTSAINVFEIGLLAGYRFKIGDHMNIGLRAVYLPQRTSKSDQDDAAIVNEPLPGNEVFLADVETLKSDADLPLVNSNIIYINLNAQYFFTRKPKYTFKPLLEL